MTAVLDEQAKGILNRLRHGDYFTLRDERGVFSVDQVMHPVEAEPWVAARKHEPAWGATAFRAIRVSRIEAIVPRPRT